MEILTDFYQLLSLIFRDNMCFQFVTDIGVDESNDLIDYDIILINFINDPVHKSSQNNILQEDVEGHGWFSDKHSEEL